MRSSNMNPSRGSNLLDSRLAAAAGIEAFRKLNPVTLFRNPIIFVTEVVALVATILAVHQVIVTGSERFAVIGQICAWLWFTVLFANFAEALAEARGKAFAESLRRTQAETKAHRLISEHGEETEDVPSSTLREGDFVIVSAGGV